LFTKHKQVAIDISDVSRTNRIGKVESQSGDIIIPGTSTAKKRDMLLGREISDSGIYLGGDINVLRPAPGLFAPKFLPYFLETEEAYEQLEGYIQGSTGIIHISNKGIKNLTVPLPSFAEQQRIVSILDECFKAIDQAKANTERNLKNAKELFDSYVQEVFEEKGEGWEEKLLKEIVTKVGSGATPRGGRDNYKSNGISLIRSMNIHDLEFRNQNLAFIDDSQAKELDGVTLQDGDVLLNITGASIARCCVFPKELIPARVNQHVSIIRPIRTLIDPQFLSFLLSSRVYKSRLLGIGEQGSTRQAITKAQIESFRISIPLMNEQIALVRKISMLRNQTRTLEETFQKKLADLEELKKSILRKAFGGEVVSLKAIGVDELLSIGL
jgi:type I restriction enzyme S subunit